MEKLVYLEVWLVATKLWRYTLTHNKGQIDADNFLATVFASLDIYCILWWLIEDNLNCFHILSVLYYVIAKQHIPTSFSLTLLMQVLLFYLVFVLSLLSLSLFLNSKILFV